MVFGSNGFEAEKAADRLIHCTLTRVDYAQCIFLRS